ncbi:[protein-PII] uridylyltransferase [Rudaea sp.]|uniref:[protein-PII] uridylyltransferase n=1 Tax=Rudaea sp. TaxID=2136325 RepID=UPI002ED3047C
MSDSSALAIALPRLPKSVPRSGVSEQARLALRQLLGDTDRRLAEAFAAIDRDRYDAATSELIRTRSRAVERIVAHVWIACVGESEMLALFAAGGFGREEMFPYSDVDLLVLSVPKPEPAALRAVESFFTCLWDIGLKPGHAVRTLAECRELAGADAVIYTSLLDARLLLGSTTLADEFARLMHDETLWPPAQYFAAKRSEEEQRRAKFNDTAYNLEPNLKDGPGGLRALHLILWLGKRLFDAPTLEALVGRGMLSADEAVAVEAARARLQHIRYALHLAAGRPEERLLFDYQRLLAERLGYTDEHARNLGVEQFMQSFFRAAIVIARLNEQFVQRCEEALDADSASVPQRLSIDFVSLGGRLDCDPPDLFLKRPAALIDLFRIWVEHPEVKGLRADLVSRINEALTKIGRDLAFDDGVNAAFARLLRKGAPAIDALIRMNRYGVLAQYLPAFGKVVGRMQYDLFHVYTVDEHTMRVLRNVARFADADKSREFALAHQLFERLAKPELLILAALFHDIAKGRGGDHSELGEKDAREFGATLGLSAADIDLVAWLVRWHLHMSVTAQRQDINDPDVVHRFAATVEDSERLDYLYLLTCADIAGTSSKLWNSWKDKLLADLYTSARYALRGGLERPPHVPERVREAQAQAYEALAELGLSAQSIGRIWSDFPEETFLRFKPGLIAWQTAGIANASDAKAPLVLVDPQGPRGGSEVFVYAPDRDGLFAAVTAVFERMRLSVLDARIVTSKSGMGMDNFLVLDANSRMLDPGTVQRLRSTLEETLRLDPYPVSVGAQRPLSRLRHFHIPTRIEFRDDAQSGRTQLALVCSDRPGLLAAVAQVFRACKLRVHDARIATFGERVEDFFQLTDEYNRMLDADACKVLREALIERLAAPSAMNTQTVETYVIS